MMGVYPHTHRTSHSMSKCYASFVVPICPCIQAMLGYPASKEKENKSQEEQLLSSMTCWGQLCADVGR